MIGWRDDNGNVHRGSLFATFAALASGAAWSFPALRPHQREPWHAFTVQVAALALIRAGQDTLPTTEAAWRDLLIGLTPEYPDGEAWDLVVDDWTKPALLQPPIVAAGDKAAYKNRLPTPDALDMLVTAKNHDVKQERMIGAGDEDWLFALVTLQTTEGFLGAGNWGVSRMNGGFANRMTLGIRPRLGAGSAFIRDVVRLVEHARARPDRRGGLALLWTIPWDGTISLSYSDLDELYVEICRRIRLDRTDSGDAIAYSTASKVSRVAYKQLGGNTLDPWAPLTIDKKKESLTYGQQVSVTASSAGFGYRQMASLLDRTKIAQPFLAILERRDSSEDLAIVAAALVRGQGKTEGLHRRVIRTSRLGDIQTQSEDPIARLGVISDKRAVDANEASRYLRNALITLVHGGQGNARFDDDVAKKKVERWIHRFDEAVDAEFFDATFWSEAARDPGNHRLVWRTRLRGIAQKIFGRAANAIPQSFVRRVRARIEAQSFLERKLNSWVEDMRHGE